MMRAIRHAVETFFYITIILAAAIALTFVEDWCAEHHRPSYLTSGCRLISIFAFLVDGFALLGLGVQWVVIIFHNTKRVIKLPPLLGGRGNKSKSMSRAEAKRLEQEPITLAPKVATVNAAQPSPAVDDAKYMPPPKAASDARNPKGSA